ncbi:MAG: NFACT RNA binding domain-containing protein [Treponema sp.]|jgi:predicted ribosome quality control (RQC) complex YloA/Tae2 family protein|nr:NFACT RNA binding domain-containing protein [Treponema sp.]
MSLNWKEIDLILSELDLPGSQIQKVIQTTFDVLCLKIHGRTGTKNILIALTSGACRMHETFKSIPKSDNPLRFAQFLNAHVMNGWIEEAIQLSDNRIVRLAIRCGGSRQIKLYVRLWSNAANVIAVDETGTVLDAMRRLPKRNEVTGGRYDPEAALAGGGKAAPKAYAIRELEGSGSFNEKIDAFYAEQGGALSLEALREQARRIFETRINRLLASLEKLAEKESDFADSNRFKEYADIILANAASIKMGDSWLDALNFYTGGTIRIELDAKQSPSQQAEAYYEKYRKAKNGLSEVREEIAAGKKELDRLETTLATLLTETNPLVLQKKIRAGADRSGGIDGAVSAQTRKADAKRPGLSFRRNEWLIIVGRDAAENDDLLRRHVKGNDLWLHVRDYAGSYVFIKQRAGKSYPLDILLDAGNLAVFYSKCRNNGEADLFYTPAKFLRRTKNGPKGLVIPTQEKNLHIKVDQKRLKELELCRIEKL